MALRFRGTGAVDFELDDEDIEALAAELEPIITRLQKAPPDPPPPTRTATLMPEPAEASGSATSPRAKG